MDATHTKKRSAAVISSPLLDFGILQNVLSYVGPGHYLFVAAISKWWKELYAALETQQLTVLSEYSRERVITCNPKSASPSRVKLAHESELDCTSEVYQCAAGRYADTAVLATVHKLGVKYTSTMIVVAARCSKLVEVQYLHKQGCPWPSLDAQLLEGAASSGYFELVRWCYEQGCFWQCTASAASHAAKSGSIELVMWVLQQSGTHMNVMKAAASKGHLPLCQYLRALGFDWDSRVTLEAAFHRHIDVLRCLIDNGCAWTGQIVCTAVNCYKVEALTYLQELRLLNCTETLAELLNDAAACNKLAAAKWLREQGAEWPTAPKWQQWSAEVLEWARAEGCPTPPY
jgi:hypothetical protein